MLISDTSIKEAFVNSLTMFSSWNNRKAFKNLRIFHQSIQKEKLKESNVCILMGLLKHAAQVVLGSVSLQGLAFNSANNVHVFIFLPSKCFANELLCFAHLSSTKRLKISSRSNALCTDT